MLRVILAAWILSTAALAEQAVEGQMVNSVTGVGIPGATVKLLQSEKTVYSATTDSQGNFRVEGVKDGIYTASYEAAHFWPIPNLFDSRSAPPPIRVNSTSDPMRLAVKMIPCGKISGQVTDAAGKPVAKAGMWLAWLGRSAGPFYWAETDEKGEYRIGDLQGGGPFLLSASAPTSWPLPESREGQRLGWSRTFYPGVTDAKAAFKIILRPGDDLWNVDVKLAAAPVRRIRGRVLDVRGDPVAGASLTLSQGIRSQSVQLSKDDGTFQFDSVVDGEWRLSAAVRRDGIALRATRVVQIHAEDWENIELRPGPPFALHGKIVIERLDGFPAPRMPSRVVFMEALPLEDTPNVSGNPDRNGEFTVALYPGLYRLLIDGTPRPYYLDSIRFGDREALESEVSILSGAPLTATYKLTGGGTVQGTVEGCGTGSVLLVPDGASPLNPGFTRRVPCAANGRFEFGGVRPGEYYALAVDSGELTPDGLDDELMKQSVRVSVHANELATAEPRIAKRQ